MATGGKRATLSKGGRLNWRGIVRSVRMLALLVAGVPLGGCTAIGFGIGAAIDISAKDKTRCVVAHVQPGTPLTLHMRDGSRRPGRFRALIEPDSASHASRHREWADTAASPGLLPAPGARVTLSGRSPAFSGSFHGLSPAGARVRPDGVATVRTVRFRDFESLTVLEGQAHASGYLEMMVQRGMVPTGTEVELLLDARSGSLTSLDQDGPSRRVAWDDVASVDAPAPSTGKWYGLVLGLTADILTLVAVAAAYSSSF